MKKITHIEELMDVLDGLPEQECKPLEYVTNPAHGGKVVCYRCGSFIDTSERYIRYGERYKHLGSDICERNLRFN